MRKALLRILAALFVAALFCCLGWGVLRYYRATYVTIQGNLYRRDLQVLDLSGMPLEAHEKLTQFYDLQQVDLRHTGATPEQYEWLRSNLPGCSIIWELPFQGSYFSRTTESITLTSLTLEEAALLDYLPLLAHVDAWDCRDYEALALLQQHHPDCKIFFNVEIGGQFYDCDTTELLLRDNADADLIWRLSFLPRLRSVRFTGNLPPTATLLELVQTYPETQFSWEGTIDGVSVNSQSLELDLSGEGYESVAELEALIRYFPTLRSLYLGATDIPEEALFALERGHPGLTIFYDMDILGTTVSRAATELDLSGIQVSDMAALEVRLALMPNLRRVVMCDCGLSSQEMAQLDERHENIRFIWSVNLGGVLLRTDATWYCPNKYYLEVDDAALEDLQYFYDMVCIDIGHNRGVTHCQWAANMPNLKYLVIADTNIKDLSPLAGLENLVFLEVFMSPVRDYRPLLECPNLEDLNLGYTYGDPTPVIQMTWLKRLWWPGSLRVLNWNVRNQLRTNIPDAKMNFVAGSSTGEGWRSGQHYYAMRDMMGMPYMTG